jgi:C4-dicarboxylate transporter, DctM subunit
LTWTKFVDGLKDSLRLSAMVFMLVIGAIIFGHFMTVTGLAQSLVDFAINTHMGPLAIVIFVSVIFFILGCFIDITPLLLILVPMFFPLIQAANIDVIYFGVIIVMLCMLGIVTPPVGTNIFVTKGLVRDEVSMATISKGILVFLAPMTLGLVLLIAFPIISTFLPTFMSY